MPPLTEPQKRARVPRHPDEEIRLALDTRQSAPTQFRSNQKRRHRMTLATVIVLKHLSVRTPDGVAMNVATTREITGQAAGAESRSHVPKSHIAHDAHEDDSQAAKCLVNFLRCTSHRLSSHRVDSHGSHRLRNMGRWAVTKVIWHPAHPPVAQRRLERPTLTGTSNPAAPNRPNSPRHRHPAATFATHDSRWPDQNDSNHPEADSMAC